MATPRVTVITSIYKASEFLFDFLLDVKRQSIFSESEILLLDANEDPDNEDAKTISKFKGTPNFKYSYIGKCSVYEAWNKGVKLAEAPVITNWNVDDRREISSLNYQVKFLEDNKEVDLCYGLLKISNHKNEIFENCGTGRIWASLDGTLENQLKHNSPHCMPVWRKDVHDRFGMFDESYFSASDYDMWFRILKGGGKLKKLDRLVGIYYENPKSISRNRKTLEKALSEVSKVRSNYSA